jgi:cytidylate kinase
VARPEHGYVVTLDGPAGSGKSTTARAVAARLGFVYLDTGALYRALTVLALDHEVPPDDGPALGRLAESVKLRISRNGSGQRVHAGKDDLTKRLRTPEVEAAVSAVSAAGEVRKAMMNLQRSQRTAPGLVAEGRDLGTVVFPDADLKIYLVAELPERARRRSLERRAAGRATTDEEEETALAARDAYDSSRELAPLRPADDAVTVDTTHLSIDEQVARVVELFRERFGA